MIYLKQLGRQLTPENVKAFLEAANRLQEAIDGGWRVGIGNATKGLYKDDLARLKKEYGDPTDQDIARALYGDDYL